MNQFFSKNSHNYNSNEYLNYNLLFVATLIMMKYTKIKVTKDLLNQIYQDILKVKIINKSRPDN